MYDDDRVASLKEEIRARLQDVCSHLPPDLFDELIDKIAAQELKSLTPDPEYFRPRHETEP
jgi:hypothetical protein